MVQLRIARAIDLSPAPFADLRGDLVNAETRACSEGQTVGLYGRSASADRITLDQRAGVDLARNAIDRRDKPSVRRRSTRSGVLDSTSTATGKSSWFPARLSTYCSCRRSPTLVAIADPRRPPLCGEDGRDRTETADGSRVLRETRRPHSRCVASSSWRRTCPASRPRITDPATGSLRNETVHQSVLLEAVAGRGPFAS